MATKSLPLRVLVVEDEPLIRWSVTETLTQAGHIVIEVQDGETALQALADATEPFDAVLLDYRLPDSHDLALLAAILKLSPRSAVILMTAFATPELAANARRLGAYHVMSKPFEMCDLEPLILRARDGVGRLELPR